MHKCDLDMIRVRNLKTRHITNDDLNPAIPTNTRLFLLSAKDDISALLRYVDKLEERSETLKDKLQHERAARIV